jgi:hypothetical protein
MSFSKQNERPNRFEYDISAGKNAVKRPFQAACRLVGGVRKKAKKV